MTYRATPQPCDPTLESQYMLTNFSSCTAADDRAARKVIGTPTRIDGRVPCAGSTAATAKKTRREKVPSR